MRNTNRYRNLLAGGFWLVIILLITSATAAQAPQLSPAMPQAMQRWQDMRFGMFIHWGPVSQTGRQIGWSRGAETPIEVYDNLYKQFAAPQFDAKARASNLYQNNLLYGADKAVDDDVNTRWATESGTRQAWLELDLGSSQSFSRVAIREWPGGGKRVQKFELQYQDGGAWKTFLTGTTIGTDFKKGFPPVTARLVRLNILDATQGPTIDEFEIFK